MCIRVMWAIYHEEFLRKVEESIVAMLMAKEEGTGLAGAASPHARR